MQTVIELILCPAAMRDLCQRGVNSWFLVNAKVVSVSRDGNCYRVLVKLWRS